jgi:putative ABC transport system permease protein
VTALLVRWRLALRLARRDALRHRGRSLLVLAMVGLPILAVVGADTLYRTKDITPVEALPTTLGAADAVLHGEARGRVWADPRTGALLDKSQPQADPPWTRAEVAAALPPGSRVRQAEFGDISYRTDIGYARVHGWADDLADSMRAGAADLVEGRFPRTPREVAVSPEIAARGAGVGAPLSLTRDDVPVTVVGVVRTQVQDGPLVLLPSADANLLAEPYSRFYATVPGGLDWAAVRALNARGLVAVSRQVVEDPPPAAAWTPPGVTVGSSSGTAAERAVLALVAASVLLEVVLLAGPAFAVGVRRQRRDLALIGAAGGSPRDLRRVVLAGGVVLGGTAAVAGAALGVASAAVAVPVIESGWDVVFGPFDVPVLHALLAVLVGVAAGLGAAYIPARQAARTDVVIVLAGRRGQVQTSWRSPVLGLIAAAVGMVLVVLGARGTELGVAGGAVLLILGIVAAAPWLVGLLAPLARWLPASARLAVRDATRNRGRTAPAVAAVMATVAGVTALAIGSASDSAQSQRDYQPHSAFGAARLQGDLDPQAWDALAAAVRQQLPDRAVRPIRGVVWDQRNQRDLVVSTVGCAGGLEHCRWFAEGGGSVITLSADVIVADPAAVRAIDTGAMPPAAYQALREGRVVVFGPGAVDRRGQVTVRGAVYDGQGNGSITGTASLPAVEVPLPAGAQVVLPARLIVPSGLADRLPVPLRTAELVTGGPEDPVTSDEQQRVSEAIAALAPGVYVSVERGWTDRLAVARLILFGLGTVLVLIATLTVTGLALSDARPDLATLAAVGAAPRTRRFVAMGSAAVVGGLGAVLGLLVGLAPGIAVAVPLTSTDYGGGAHPVLAIPWAMLGGVAVAVPLLAVAVTGAVVRSRLPMARRMAA